MCGAVGITEVDSDFGAARFITTHLGVVFGSISTSEVSRAGISSLNGVTGSESLRIRLTVIMSVEDSISRSSVE